MFSNNGLTIVNHGGLKTACENMYLEEPFFEEETFIHDWLYQETNLLVTVFEIAKMFTFLMLYFRFL